MNKGKALRDEAAAVRREMKYREKARRDSELILLKQIQDQQEAVTKVAILPPSLCTRCKIAVSYSGKRSHGSVPLARGRAICFTMASRVEEREL